MMISCLPIASLILLFSMAEGSKDIDFYSCKGAMTLAKMIAGSNGAGATVESAKFTGKTIQAACFRSGNRTLRFDKGIVLSNSNALKAGIDYTSKPGDEDLNGPGFQPFGADSRDAAVLEVKFKCPANKKRVSVSYIYGTNEIYQADYDGNYDDPMGIFLNGLKRKNNIAVVNGYNISAYSPVMSYDSAYLIYDTPTNTKINMERFSKPLATKKVLGKNNVNTITIAVADDGDNAGDSYLFVRSGGLRCT